MLSWLLKQMRKLLASTIVLALPLLADDRPKETLSRTDTARFNLPATGSIRLQNSFGELDIEGWDNPEVEVTVIRSTERLYDAKARIHSSPKGRNR